MVHYLLTLFVAVICECKCRTILETLSGDPAAVERLLCCTEAIIRNAFIYSYSTINQKEYKCTTKSSFRIEWKTVKQKRNDYKPVSLYTVLFLRHSFLCFTKVEIMLPKIDFFCYVFDIYFAIQSNIQDLFFLLRFSWESCKREVWEVVLWLLPKEPLKKSDLEHEYIHVKLLKKDPV